MNAVALVAHSEIHDTFNHVIRDEQMPLHVHCLKCFAFNRRRFRRPQNQSTRPSFVALLANRLHVMPIPFDLTDKMPRLVESADHFGWHVFAIYQRRFGNHVA